jgi:YD repeat-containing protein
MLMTNPLGYVTTLSFTSLGSIQSVVDSTGRSTSYAWGPFNRLLGITDGLGRATSFSYRTQRPTRIAAGVN